MENNCQSDSTKLERIIRGSENTFSGLYSLISGSLSRYFEVLANCCVTKNGNLKNATIHLDDYISSEEQYEDIVIDVIDDIIDKLLEDAPIVVTQYAAAYYKEVCTKAFIADPPIPPYPPEPPLRDATLYLKATFQSHICRLMEEPLPDYTYEATYGNFVCGYDNSELLPYLYEATFMGHQCILRDGNYFYPEYSASYQNFVCEFEPACDTFSTVLCTSSELCELSMTSEWLDYSCFLADKTFDLSFFEHECIRNMAYEASFNNFVCILQDWDFVASFIEFVCILISDVTTTTTTSIVSTTTTTEEMTTTTTTEPAITTTTTTEEVTTTTTTEEMTTTTTTEPAITTTTTTEEVTTTTTTEIPIPPEYLIDDLFPSLMCIVNQEMNCYSEGTPISLVAIDTIEQTITVDWIPEDMPISVTAPEVGKEWVLAIGIGLPYEKDYAFVKITGGDPVTKVLNYTDYETSKIENFVVDAEMIYYNPFNNGWTEVASVAQEVGTYYSLMHGPGGVWKHSDGTFRMAVNGHDNTNWQVGLFQSVDMINWTAVSPDAKITFNTSDWRMDGIHVSGVIQHPTEEGMYFGISYGQSDEGYFRIGYVKFDENMENVAYSATEIIDTTGTVSGFYSPSIIFYNGKYRVYACRRGTYYEMYEYSADVPEGPYTFERIAIPSTAELRDTLTVYRYYSNMMFPFLIGNELFAIIDGTGVYDESGNKGNRQFGVFKYNTTTQAWDDVRNGMVLANWYFALTTHGLLSGHNGGSPILYDHEGVMYFFAAKTFITDDYSTFVMSKRIYFPEVTNNAKVTINTDAPVVAGALTETTGSSLTAGLLSVWEFDETSGTTVNDSYGDKNYTHNLIIDQVGKIDKCYRGTGTQCILGGTSDFSFGANEDFTISMWFKLSVWSYIPWLISKRQFGGDGKGYYLYYESRSGFFDSNSISKTHALTFVIDAGATIYQVCTGAESIPANNTDWHHAIIYREGAKMGIKIDGGTVNEYTNASIAGTLVNTTVFTLFRDNSTTELSGYLDQTAIWSRALTSDEMAQINNSNNGLPFSEW